MFRVAPTARGGALRAVRHYFGLSQTDLAPFLGLSQPEVAQVESGQRPLPLRAGQALALLAAHLPPTANPAPPADPTAPALPALPAFSTPAAPDPLDPLDEVALLAHQRQCAAQAVRLRAQLARLTERASQARRRLAALPALRAAVEPALATDAPRARAAHERQHLWLALFENEARLELTRSGATPQARLTLRLGALLHEAAHAAALLPGGSPA